MDALMSNDGSRPSVLVVDDQNSIREMVVRMLARHGIVALQAGSAEDALCLINRHKDTINLVIIDMVMPGVTGLDLAAELSREQSYLRILYISGYVGSLAVDVIARRSPQVVLLKPFTERELVDRVNLLLAEASPNHSAAASSDDGAS